MVKPLPRIQSPSLRETEFGPQPNFTQNKLNFQCGPNPFRFEIFWMNHETFPSVTKEAWGRITLAIYMTQQSPSKTNFQLGTNSCFCNILNQKRRTQAGLLGVSKKLDTTQTPHLLKLEKTLQHNLTLLLDYEESSWQMKSRVQWLTLGDKNMKYFHSNVIRKRRRNKILQIQRKDLTWLTDPKDIKQEHILSSENNFCNISNQDYVILDNLNLPN